MITVDHEPAPFTGARSGETACTGSTRQGGRRRVDDLTHFPDGAAVETGQVHRIVSRVDTSADGRILGDCAVQVEITFNLVVGRRWNSTGVVARSPY